MKPLDDQQRLDADCIGARDLLPLHVGGDLDPNEALSVERHLAQCEDCRAVAAHLSEARQRFFEVGLSTAAEELSAGGLWAGIAAALERERAGAVDPTRGDGPIERLTDLSLPRPSATPAPSLDENDVWHELERGEHERSDFERSDFERREHEASVAGSIREVGYPGGRALRLMGGAMVVAAATLLVAVLVSKTPRQDLPVNSVADAVVAPSVVPVTTVADTGGFERLTPADGTRRLVFQPREVELVPSRSDRESLVGHPTWR